MTGKARSILKNNTSINILLVSLVAVILFHLFIIAKIIPFEYAWGGRIKNDFEMYVFETISLPVNLFLGVVLLIKAGYVKPYFSKKYIDFILSLFLILIVLNTVGNLMANTNFEKSFAIVTFVFAILILKILKTKQI